MIKKIIKVFKNPFLIIDKIKIYFLKKNYNKENFVREQNNIFLKYKLNREKGVTKYNDILDKNKILHYEMTSEHQIFFSSLSLSKEFNVTNILEIGTWDAKNACLLSILFENASIDTIDLSREHEIFKNSYNRTNKVDEFVNRRDILLEKYKKINFKELNSLNLYNYTKKYDLIWIDGAHGYPFVCMDIINCLKLLNTNGLIMCDDVFINKINSDKLYQSNASYETLSELKKEKIIEFNLIYKRLDTENNFNSGNRKFVAIVELNK